MDAVDRKILKVLQQDARASLQQVGQAVGLSASPCWERIKKMEEAGVIEGYTVRLNPQALGLTLDIGHIVCLEPMSVTECVRRGASTLAHVHIEDMKRGIHEHLLFGEGELDLGEALAVLNEVGYDGMVAVELSRHSHAAHETVPAAMSALRAAEREGVR